MLGRKKERTEAFANKHKCKACYSIDELMELQPNYTAEASSVSSVVEYSETILKAGSHLVILSIGAFADEYFYEHIKNIAGEANRKVYIASGAVGGFDILRTAALMSPISASIASQKAPKSLIHTPLNFDGLAALQERAEVFHGTTKEAIAILPTHVNVAVATALASAGPASTQMHIEAVPEFVGDEYKIEIEGEEVHTELNIYSKTSKVAAWSVIAVLQNAVSPIVF